MDSPPRIDHDDDSRTAIPRAETFSAIYDKMLALADEELPSPFLRAWMRGRTARI